MPADLGREIGGGAHAVHVHVEDARRVAEEVIVERRRVEAGVEHGRHDRIHFALGQHEVAHHHFHAPVALGHRDPAAEAERRWDEHAGNGYRQIVARDVDLETLPLKSPWLPSALSTAA